MAEKVLEAEFGPLFTALLQDVNARHPLTALPADIIADAVARGLVSEANGKAAAARNGIDAGRFATLLARARVRLQPGELAEAGPRSHMAPLSPATTAQAAGLTPAGFRVP